MSESVFKITLGEYTFALTDCVSENARIYAKEPRRSLSGDLVLGNINTYFVPRLQATISLMTDVQYAIIAKYVKKQQFAVKYFDEELGKIVEHVMVLNDLKKGRLVRNNYIGTEVSLESVESYDTFEALLKKEVKQ